MVHVTEHLRCDISNIMKPNKIASMWRKLAGSAEKRLPQNVPPGHLAVTVGQAGKRFVIRADHLNHPILRQLLDQAYEEYGANRAGPLAITCDEFVFQDIIDSLRNGTNVNQFSFDEAEGSYDQAHARIQDDFFKAFQEDPHNRRTAGMISESNDRSCLSLQRALHLSIVQK